MSPRNLQRFQAVKGMQTSSGDARPVKSVTYTKGGSERVILQMRQRESTASIKDAPKPYAQASPPTRQTIIEFDCRGLEFTTFRSDVQLSVPVSCTGLLTLLYQGEWTAKGLESPTKFSAIDLQEGEWFDYDEKAGEEVSIKDVKWEIRRA